MDEKMKKEAGKAGVTERGIMLMEECDRFIKENDDILSTGDIENDKQMKRAKEVIKKIKWYERELEIEREKSADPFEMFDKFIIRDGDRKKMAM